MIIIRNSPKPKFTLSIALPEFKKRQFSLKAANNIDISIIGVSFFDFVIPDNKISLKVPFILTDQLLEDYIISLNVIEHITTNLPFTESEPILKSALPRFATKKN